LLKKDFRMTNIPTCSRHCLAPPDPDIVLALQPLIEAVHARSHYDRDIDYRRALHPPLSPAEAAWLAQRLGQPQPPT
jgi:hypothetical protein